MATGYHPGQVAPPTADGATEVASSLGDLAELSKTTTVVTDNIARPVHPRVSVLLLGYSSELIGPPELSLCVYHNNNDWQ